MRPNSKCVTVGLMEKDLLHKLIKAARKTTCHCNVSEDDIPLQCRGRRHVIAMSRKKTCPKISCGKRLGKRHAIEMSIGKRHAIAMSRKTKCPCNVYWKTTCHCNVCLTRATAASHCLTTSCRPL